MEERQQIVRGVLESKNFPTGMELFPAGASNQLEIIKEWIAESDVVILLLGGRYGSLHESGKSYTEIEFDHAISLKKPVIAIILEDSYLHGRVSHALENKQSKEMIIEEGDGATKLKAFKARVMSDHMIKKVDRTNDIHAEVYRSLRELKDTKGAQMTGWVRGHSTVEAKCLADLRVINESVTIKVSLTDDFSDLFYLMFSVSDCEKSRASVRSLVSDSTTFSNRLKGVTHFELSAMYDLQGEWDLLVKYRATGDSQAVYEAIADRLAKQKYRVKSKFWKHAYVNVLWQSKSIAGLVTRDSGELVTHARLSSSDEYSRCRAQRAFLLIEAPTDHHQRQSLFRTLHKKIWDAPSTAEIIESASEGLWYMTSTGRRQGSPQIMNQYVLVLELFARCSQVTQIQELNRIVGPEIAGHNLQKYTLSAYHFDEIEIPFPASTR